MPGEPFTSEKNISAETKANIRKLYGLDRPLWEQYYVPQEHYHRRLLRDLHK